MRIIKIDDKFIESFDKNTQIRADLPVILVNLSKYPTHVEITYDGYDPTIAYNLIGRRVYGYIGNTPIVILSWETPFILVNHERREIAV